MKIIKIFDGYFLILMIIQGLILIFIDGKKFSKRNFGDVTQKAKVIGVISIVISCAFYLFNTFAT